MISPVVKAVARRDLRSWFSNPAGYVFILIFVVVAAAVMVFNDDFFSANLANLDTLNRLFPLLLCLFVPAITMSTWSTERWYGTMELLFTLPAKDSEILLGKFVAAAVIYTTGLAFMLALPLGLEILGDPDWGQIFANFLGYWLFGVMLISMAMVGSQLSTNLTVSFILGALFCVVGAFSVYLLHLLLPGVGTQWAIDGPGGQFAQFARGLVPVAGIVLFGGMTTAFFYLNLSLLARRHWRQGDATAMHAAVRFVAMAVCCLGGTGFLVHTMTPLDATVERIHSLSAETEKLIANIDQKRPVYITAFVSGRVPAMLEQQKRNLLNLLERYDSIGGAGVEKQVIFTEPYTDEARKAQDEYGIQPMGLPDEGGSNFSDGVFLGFVVQCGLEEVKVPFLEPGLSVEYELTRSIRVAAGAARKTVGVLKTDVELYGGLDFQGGSPRQKERWRIVDELQMQYKVENVDADSDYTDKLDALVVPQPSSLGQEQMDRLQRWIAAGHPTLLLEDTYPMSAPGTAAAEPKGGPMAQFNPQAGGQKGDLQRLLSGFGLSLPIQDVVWDQSFRTFQMGDVPPEFLFVDRKGIDQTDPVTAGLGRVVMMLSGQLRINDRQGLTIKPLLRSVPGPDSPNGIIQRDRIFVWNPFGASNQWDPNRPWRLSPREYVLAARVTGTVEGSNSGGDNTPPPSKPVSLIVVADLDAFSNTFFQLRSMNADNANLRFDNVTFVLNCIDSLAGDDSLIQLRKRRPILRSLTAVTEAQEQFENDWIKERDAANAAAEKELADAQKRLDDAVAKIEGSKEMDANTKDLRIAEARENEQKNLELRKREIEDEKRTRIGLAKRSKEVQKQSVQAGYQMKTMLFAFLPPLLLGLLTFFRRLAKETRNVPRNRMVGGGDR